MMILYRLEEYKRARAELAELEAEKFERSKRRGCIDTLARYGSYWMAIGWLSVRAGQHIESTSPPYRFLSMAEAIAYFAPRRQDRPELRMAYVAARYFNRYGRRIWR